MTPHDSEQHPADRLGIGILNHNEGAARDSAPAPEQPMTTLVSTALGPKMPPGAGDASQSVGAANDRQAPQQPTTTLVSAALGPKLPPGNGD